METEIIVGIIAALVSIGGAIFAWFQAHSVIQQEAKYKFYEKKLDALTTVFSGFSTHSPDKDPSLEDYKSATLQIADAQYREKKKVLADMMPKYHSIRHFLPLCKVKEIEDIIASEEALDLAKAGNEKGAYDADSFRCDKASKLMYRYVLEELRNTSNFLNQYNRYHR